MTLNRPRFTSRPLLQVLMGALTLCLLVVHSLLINAPDNLVGPDTLPVQFTPTPEALWEAKNPLPCTLIPAPMTTTSYLVPVHPMNCGTIFEYETPLGPRRACAIAVLRVSNAEVEFLCCTDSYMIFLAICPRALAAVTEWDESRGRMPWFGLVERRDAMNNVIRPVILSTPFSASDQDKTPRAVNDASLPPTS